MPNPTLPPTPGSSTDIRGKTQVQTLAPAFNLPPPAVADAAADRTSVSTTPSSNGSDSSYHPVSPNSTETNKRKHASTQARSAKSSDSFPLPPPPSRSRKIIQMKPRGSVVEQQEQTEQDNQTTTTTGKGGRKKGGNTGNTAAGRKIARKTAHSLIERRRRSKMNEEFGVLKEMIPACQGQEMHKLAILSASIEYLRYLEQCVSDLQSNSMSATKQAQPPPRRLEQQDEVQEDENDSDEEMADHAESEPPTPAPTAASAPSTRPSTSHIHNLPSLSSVTSLSSLPSLSQIASQSLQATSSAHQSPSLLAQDSSKVRHFSISSASMPSYSPYMPSLNTSPMFNAQSTGLGSDVQRFTLSSPALRPQDSQSPNEARERSDREAMAALLMLNNDRRGSSTGIGYVSGTGVWRNENGERQAKKVDSVREGQKNGRSRAMNVRDLLTH